MLKNKYSTVLTIILIITIIAIIVIAAILGLKAYKSYENNKNNKRTIAELEESEWEKEELEENDISENENTIIQPVIDNPENQNTTNNNAKPKIEFYEGYPTIGYIKIEKTGVEYNILLDVSPGALETAVGVMYPTNPQLNKPGNVVIIGHNYRNGNFFSNNKKLVTGDKIQITDLKGKTLTYTIYEIFETTPNDTEYITRNRGNNIEISLSTCTDDGNRRLIILARAN